MKITIVGIGALGSHVALLLRNEGDLTLVDFDRVEPKNVRTQLHGRSSVGRNKAEASRQLLRFLYGLSVDAVPHRLTASNADQLLSGSDLVVDCVDHGETRRIIQSCVRKHNISCLHGALAPIAERFGRVIWDEAFVPDDGQGEATCEGDDTAALTIIARVASYTAYAAQLYLREGRRTNFHVHAQGTSTL